MYNLPRETHCYFVEPITEKSHLKAILVRRFLNFVNKIENSEKIALKNVLNTVKNNTLSVTGKNLRNIMLLTEKVKISDLTPEDADSIKYREVPEKELWRIGFLKELIELKDGDLQVNGFSYEEFDDFVKFVCTT